MTKAKNLPDVWVVFQHEKGSASYAKHVSSLRVPIAEVGESVHRYTPAKPAKVCVWEWDPATQYWKSRCEMAASRNPEMFCHYCGGKIKVKR